MKRGLPVPRGFTLMELLVAIALFAAVSAVAYGGLRSAAATRQATLAHADGIAALQRAFAQLGLDLSQLAQRPGRDAQGDTLPAFLLAGSETDPVLVLVRGGRGNPAGLPRANLQRLEYRRVGDRVERLAWRSLDQTPGETPVVREWMTGVASLAWRFVDAAGDWHDDWPPVRRRAGAATLPAGVELVAVTEHGEIRRLFLTGAGT